VFVSLWPLYHGDICQYEKLLEGSFLQLLWTACKTQNTNLETVGQVFVMAKEKF